MSKLSNLIKGDCHQSLLTMESNTIDLTVTSPPYDNLRHYSNTIDWSFDKFKMIANELYRVTANGGVVVWVVGERPHIIVEQ